MVNNCFNFSLFVLCVKTAESFLSLKFPFVRVTVKKRLDPVVVRSGSRKKQVTIIIFHNFVKISRQLLLCFVKYISNHCNISYIKSSKICVTLSKILSKIVLRGEVQLKGVCHQKNTAFYNMKCCFRPQQRIAKAKQKST